MATLEKSTLTCKDVLKKENITSEELVFLLDCRKKKLIDFLLVDIREAKEHQDLSIEGTDVLFPMSKMNLYPQIIEELRHIDFVLYCSDGKRSEYMMSIFKNMGYMQLTQLKDGVMEYLGKTNRNSVPKTIF